MSEPSELIAAAAAAESFEEEVPPEGADAIGSGSTLDLTSDESVTEAETEHQRDQQESMEDMIRRMHAAKGSGEPVLDEHVAIQRLILHARFTTAQILLLTRQEKLDEVLAPWIDDPMGDEPGKVNLLARLATNNARGTALCYPDGAPVDVDPVWVARFIDSITKGCTRGQMVSRAGFPREMLEVWLQQEKARQKSEELRVGGHELNYWAMLIENEHSARPASNGLSDFARGLLCCLFWVVVLYIVGTYRGWW